MQQSLNPTSTPKAQSLDGLAGLNSAEMSIFERSSRGLGPEEKDCLRLALTELVQLVDQLQLRDRFFEVIKSGMQLKVDPSALVFVYRGLIAHRTADLGVLTPAPICELARTWQRLCKVDFQSANQIFWRLVEDFVDLHEDGCSAQVYKMYTEVLWVFLKDIPSVVWPKAIEPLYQPFSQLNSGHISTQDLKLLRDTIVNEIIHKGSPAAVSLVTYVGQLFGSIKGIPAAERDAVLTPYREALHKLNSGAGRRCSEFAECVANMTRYRNLGNGSFPASSFAAEIELVGGII